MEMTPIDKAFQIARRGDLETLAAHLATLTPGQLSHLHFAANVLADAVSEALIKNGITP